MKYKIRGLTLFLSLALFLMLFLAGCSGGTGGEGGAGNQSAGTTSQKAAEFTKLSDFDGKRMAALTGAVFDKMMKPKLPNLIFLYYDDLAGEIEAVRTGKTDGLGLDEPVARLVVAQKPELAIFPEVVVDDEYGFALRKGDPLAQKASEAIRKMAKDGTTDEMAKRWFGIDESVKKLPKLSYKSDFDGSAGVLRFGHDTNIVPMAYVGDSGQSLGYEVEIAARIAYELNMKLELVQMSFGSMIPALNAGKVDMVGGCLSITEERKKVVDFTDGTYKGGIVIVAKKDRMVTAEAGGEAAGAVENSGGVTEKSPSMLDGLKVSFRRTFVEEDRYKMILSGLRVTFLISILSLFFGTIFGALICMARMSRSNWLNVPAKIYIRLIQGTPMMVFLLILYYIVFAKVFINPVAVATMAFSLNFAAYSSEMFRTGIDAVDKGQREAASAIGFNKLKVFWKIIYPQAAHYVIPVFKGEFINNVKATSIVGYISIQDLTKMSDIIRSRTYEAFFPLIMTAAIYFVITYLVLILLGQLEKRLDPMSRKRVVKGVVEQ